MTARLRPFTLLILVVAAAIAVVGGVVALTGPSDEASARSASGLGPQGRVPQFKVECAWSHSAPDDPIVHPGAPGRSHLHDFFGNVATDADSSLTALLPEDTTCQNKLDTAAYWAPALLQDGAPVIPTGSVAYYRPGPGVDPESVGAYPPAS